MNDWTKKFVRGRCAHSTKSGVLRNAWRAAMMPDHLFADNVCPKLSDLRCGVLLDDGVFVQNILPNPHAARCAP